jgi:hypothetical protein
MDWLKPELKTKKEKDPVKEIVTKYIKGRDRLSAEKNLEYRTLRDRLLSLHGGRVSFKKEQGRLIKLFMDAVSKIKEAILRGHSKDKALGYVQETLKFEEHMTRRLVELMNQNLDFFQQRGMWS